MEWMCEGYAFLISTGEPPSLTDGEEMGWDTYYDIMQLREKRISLEGGFPSGLAWPRRLAMSELKERWFKLLQSIRNVFSADFLKAEQISTVRIPISSYFGISLTRALATGTASSLQHIAFKAHIPTSGGST